MIRIICGSGFSYPYITLILLHIVRFSEDKETIVRDLVHLEGGVAVENEVTMAYNERQLIHVTVVNVCVHGRNVGVITRGTAGGREPVGLFFAIDLVVHLLLNGTSLVTRDGAEDAHVRVPYPRALCKLYKPNLFLQPSQISAG